MANDLDYKGGLVGIVADGVGLQNRLLVSMW